MKVKELRELLNKLDKADDELEVMVAPPYDEILKPAYLTRAKNIIWLMTTEYVNEYN